MRTVVIGIDGVPYGMMETLSDKGIMPNFKDLRSQGTFAQMKSTLPEVSSASWATIITGENPGEHGIYGFTELMPGTYNMFFPNYMHLQAKPYWERGGRHVVINVPMTYPAREMNGVHIAGFVAPDLEKAVYPASALPALQEMGYKVDVDTEKAKESKLLFMSELNKTNEARIKAYRHFWEKEKWDMFTFVFTGSDRLGHYLWDAYEDDGHEFHQGFLDYFARVDEVIGEITGKMGEDDRLVIISDHGMEKAKTNVNINALLEEAGLLKLGEGRGYGRIAEGTRAFAMEPSRIYVHREGRYPRGSVAKADEEKVVDEIGALFKGQEFVKRVFRRDEIYRGKNIGNAPDIVLLCESGWNLRAQIGGEKMYPSPLAGHHTYEDAFILTNAKVPEGPSVEDVTKAIGDY
ncbi:MAG: alkaline phosphatase family protein [Candidatus Diapherotrites archaeon]|nr:alkaline phosphatase family protein [Candidatus Diapherotrites archaeon]